MGKYFAEQTSDKLTKTARTKFVRTVIGGILNKLPGSGVVQSKVIQPVTKKVLKSKAGPTIQKAVAFVDEPAKLLTKNKKSPLYVKGTNLERKGLYTAGKVLGAPVRHPILTATGIVGYDMLAQQNARKAYAAKAFKTSNMTTKDLNNLTHNKYDDYFLSPNADEVNRVMGTNYTQDQVNKNLRAQASAYPTVKGIGSKYSYKDLNTPTSVGWNYDVGDSLISARNNVYQGLHSLADAGFTKRYYKKPIDNKESQNIYNEIKDSYNKKK